jgi:hypothetical protein
MKQYRIKTEAEFEKEFGKEWRVGSAIGNWTSPYGVLIMIK